MKQAVVFPRTRDLKTDTKNILKNFFDKTLDESILVYYILNRQRDKPNDGCENITWGPEVQTPSYILSPLDSGAHTTV